VPPTEENIKVLLIEDNPGDARLVREALRERVLGSSFQVVTASRLADGVARLGSQGFDVVLLDLSLPDSSGLETFHRLREASPGVPVLILTGLEDETVGTTAMADGAQDYVLKRYLSTDILPRAIVYALSRRALMGQLEDRMRELRDSEERYRSLVDGVDAIVWESNMERRRFSFVSQQVEEILGFPASDFTDNEGFWASRLHPADMERVVRRRAQAGPRGGGEHVLEYRFKDAKGQWVWIRDIVRVLRKPDGAPWGLTGVMIDVSEVVAIQEYRENLVDVISHEFRTPVTVIQGYAQLLTEPGASPKPATVAAAREKIETASRHLSYLLNSITELSRLRRGGAPPLVESLPSREVVEEAIEALGARGRGFQGRIEVLVHPGGEHLMADRRKLVIALVELLDNAAKFSPADAPIWVGIRAEVDAMVMTVEDRGPGIPDSMRDGLFKPFVQADMTAVRATGGAGLGLAVVSGLVEAQGGRIELDTVVGQGTAMHIVLPRARPKPV
jgi:PAS domain S-box-containing protein